MDDTVRLKSGQGQVDDPESEQEDAGKILESCWTAELSSHVVGPPEQQDKDGEQGFCAEQHDGKP